MPTSKLFSVSDSSGAGITALTGDVTAVGPGSAAATIAKIQNKTVSGTTGTGNVVFSASPTLTGTTSAQDVEVNNLGFPDNAAATTRNIYVDDQATLNTNANRLDISGGTGNGTGSGSTIQINPGDGGATGAGGGFAVAAGASNGGAQGGTVSVRAGDGTGGNIPGGQANFSGGIGSGSGSGGQSYVEGGAAGATGTGGAAGAYGGAGGATSGNGGPAFLTAGNATTSGNGGDIRLTPGTGAGGGATGKIYIPGTDTNDNAAAGYIGEYVQQVVGNTAMTAASAAFQDLASISLTAGDWDVTATAVFTVGDATGVTYVGTGISTTTGNSGAGLVEADNLNYLGTSLPIDSFVVVPSYRMSLSTTTAVYQKGSWGGASGHPGFYAKISARRVR